MIGVTLYVCKSFFLSDGAIGVIQIDFVYTPLFCFLSTMTMTHGFTHVASVDMREVQDLANLRTLVRRLCVTDDSSPCLPLTTLSYYAFQNGVKSMLLHHTSSDNQIETLLMPSLQPVIKLRYTPGVVTVSVARFKVEHDTKDPPHSEDSAEDDEQPTFRKAAKLDHRHLSKRQSH